MLLHGGLFAFFIFQIHQTSQQSELPIGIEVFFPQESNPIFEVQQKPDRHIQKVKKIESEKVVVPTPAEQNQVARTSEQVVTGREGVANGIEVTAEVRYIYELKKMLERKKMYPQMAKSMGHQGVVQVQFVIDRAGKILSHELLKTSHPLLNKAALDLIRAIDGQKPFPTEISKLTWKISVPIEYSLH